MSETWGILQLLSIFYFLYVIGEWLENTIEEEEKQTIVKKYKKVIEVVPKDKK